jgi:prepilin-type N-terminal cleavage/methylation domain-containing protein
MSARTRRLRDLLRRDDGFSLTEVMVSMALMSVVMAIATSGFITMYRTTDLAETASLTQASLQLSFEKLDRDVRYANRINVPYTRSNGDFAVDYVIAGDDGVLQCVRLTLPAAGGALTRLQWPQPGTPAGVAATTVALDLASTNGSATPFTVVAGGTGGSNFDRLQVQLTSTVGVTGAGSTRTFDLRFTALNTAPSTTTLSCSQA